MSQSRYALLIANYQFDDPSVTQLIAPEHDAEALAEVLSDKSIGDFDVTTIINKKSYEINEHLEDFFDHRKKDDLILLYYSGHGIKDKDGLLYFASRDTKVKRLRSTAIEANFINDMMRQCRSRQQILILDSCYSGAFARGMKVRSSTEIGTGEFFKEGRGKVVLTASDSMQYAFEEDQVTGQAQQSIFTKTMIKGLTSGEADIDQDGVINFDELYNYVHDHVTQIMPEQEPRKWAFDVKGDIIIANNPSPIARTLPKEVQSAINNPITSVREAIIKVLARYLNGHDRGLEISARQELEILINDDSRRVSSAARVALGLDGQHVESSAPVNKPVDTPASVQAQNLHPIKPPTGTPKRKPMHNNTPDDATRPRPAQVKSNTAPANSESKFKPSITGTNLNKYIFIGIMSFIVFMFYIIYFAVIFS